MFEKLAVLQRRFSRVLNTDPPIRFTIARIKDNFEADETIQDVHKQRSG